MGDYYFLMCLLPPMGSVLGEKLPMPLGDISAVVRRHLEPEDRDLGECLLAGIDAANWEQADQGNALFLEGGLVSREQMSNRENLPDFIRRFREEKERGISRACVYDRLWELYYLWAYGAAQAASNGFLTGYWAWEIDLRAGLAFVRARDAGRRPEDHAVMEAFRYADFSGLVTRLKSQHNPLDAERLLDEERLRQIYRLEGNSPFSLDALLAYVARALIYGRWERISRPFDIEAYLLPGGTL